MMSEDVVLIAVDRLVQCANCGRDEVTELYVTFYDTVEVAEWACPECGETNEYEHDTVSDRVDEYIDRMKEGW